jgi:hypothetical protein
MLSLVEARKVEAHAVLTPDPEPRPVTLAEVFAYLQSWGASREPRLLATFGAEVIDLLRHLIDLGLIVALHAGAGEGDSTVYCAAGKGRS